MARQYTGWLDDQGGQHETQEAAEAADAAHLDALARETLKKVIYQAICWERQTLDVEHLLRNAATLITNIEHLVADAS